MLYLSAVAANAQPLDVASSPQSVPSIHGAMNGAGIFSGVGSGIMSSISKPRPLHKHRRMSSSGQARRRLSDAREANSRPSCVESHIIIMYTFLISSQSCDYSDGSRCPLLSCHSFFVRFTSDTWSCRPYSIVHICFGYSSVQTRCC